jgi:hypothetical protein
MKDISLTFRWIVYMVYLVTLFFIIVFLVHPVLLYHLTQPSFLTNYAFFSEFLKYPGGLTEYLSAFLMQLFSFNWLGTCLILLLTGILLFLSLNISRLFVDNILSYPLSSFPAILFLSLFNNYYFPLTSGIEVILAFFFVWLFGIYSKRKSNPFLLFLTLAIIAYYVAGSGTYMLFAVGAMLLSLSVNGFRKSFVLLLIGIALSLVVPYISFKYLFNIPMTRAYFNLVPDLHPIISYKVATPFKWYAISLPLLMILSLIIKGRTARRSATEDTENQNTQIISETASGKRLSPNGLFLLTSLFILVTTLLILKKTTNGYFRDVVLTDYYGYTGQWDKVITTAKKQHFYNLLINYNYNRAIEKKGNLARDLFNYPQMLGSDIFYPNRVAGSDIALVSSDFYYDLGYMSESLHWAHEAQTVFHYSPRVLERMVMVNLIFGNYRTAEKYLDVLDDNFLCNQFVKKYKPMIVDTSLVKNDNEIMLKRYSYPRGCIVAGPEINFKNLLARNNDNQSAYEHLILYYILNHNLDAFFQNINLGKRFYAASPKIFEEALVVQMIDTKNTGLSKLKLSKEVKQTVGRYNEIMNKYNYNKKRAQKELYQTIGDSYMYYLMYYKPKKTAIATK